MTAAPYSWPPPPSTPPTRPEEVGGVGYERLLTLGRPGRWRYAVGILTLVVLVLLIQVGVVAAAGLVLVLTGRGVGETLDLLTGDPVTPAFLAVVNLGWAFAIPAVWLVVWLLHRLPPRWVSSIKPRLRLAWFGLCLLLSVVALVVTLLVAGLIVPTEEALGMEPELNSWSSEIGAFLLVVLLLTPLQAAGEEYAFRGYLLQATAGLTRSRIVAVLASAAVFAVAHGAGQSIPVFFDRFAFGIVAGVLVIATGGLEAAIAMHIVNNFVAFGVALAFGDMTEALHAPGGSWWTVPVTVTQSLTYLGLAYGAARLVGVNNRTTPALPRRPPPGPGQGGVLYPPRGRV